MFSFICFSEVFIDFFIWPQTATCGLAALSMPILFCCWTVALVAGIATFQVFSRVSQNPITDLIRDDLELFVRKTA